MPLHTPQGTISNRHINRCGNALKEVDAIADLGIDDLTIINLWRAQHKIPLNTIYRGINRHSKHIRHAFVSQRLKRMTSIQYKLNRFPSMGLAQMQDLGGCRVVVQNIAQVYRLIDSYEDSYKRHTLSRSSRDYIAAPKIDGYRSVHRIYHYVSDKRPDLNSMAIEVQFRTKLQHAWATALESVDLALGMDMKLGGGDKDWKRFFKITSNLISMVEHSAKVPYAPIDIWDNYRLLKKINTSIDALSRLETLNLAIRKANTGDGYKGYQVISIYRDNNNTQQFTKSFKQSEYPLAVEYYSELELNASKSSHVLVSTSSAATLLKAYPNYFLDVSSFIGMFKRFMSRAEEAMK